MYPLINPLPWRYDDEECSFCVEGLSPTYVGNAENVSGAKADFSIQMHLAFQRLNRIPAHDRRPEERESWKFLCGYVDVAAYRERAPLVIRRVGTVADASTNKPWTVEWIDGEIEAVPLERAPADFASYGVNTKFEAYVVYRRRGGCKDIGRSDAEDRDSWNYRNDSHDLVEIVVCKPLIPVLMSLTEARTIWSRKSGEPASGSNKTEFSQ